MPFVIKMLIQVNFFRSCVCWKLNIIFIAYVKRVLQVTGKKVIRMQSLGGKKDSHLSRSKAIKVSKNFFACKYLKSCHLYCSLHILTFLFFYRHSRHEYSSDGSMEDVNVKQQKPSSTRKKSSKYVKYLI